MIMQQKSPFKKSLFFLLLTTFLTTSCGGKKDGSEKQEKDEKENTGDVTIQERLDTITVSRPPLEGCIPPFVQNVANYPQYPDGKRDCDDHPNKVIPLCVEVYYAIYPGSSWETVVGLNAINAELKRAATWYSKYCINIKFIPVAITNVKMRKILIKKFEVWNANNPNPGISDTQGKIFEREIAGGIYKEVKGASGSNLAILFFERHYFFASSGSGKRITQGSGTYNPDQIIGIHGIEKGSTNIVTHELIHAFGKPKGGGIGNYTWFHDCNCPNAMSRIIRTNPNTPVTLESSRKLDYAELADFATSGQLKVCK